jgi:hypothetical protein
MSFRNLAIVRFQNAPAIHGCGRFALVNENTGQVHLYLTEDEAKRSAPYHNSAVFDLQPTPVPDLKDDWEDRSRARREARERQRS